MDNNSPQAVELTPRVCGYCSRTYVAPLHSRWEGCRTCCPTFEDLMNDRIADPVTAAVTSALLVGRGDVIEDDGIPY